MKDMGDERDFIENLLNQRFNFLIVFFTLVIGGAVSANCQEHFTIILDIGALICWLVSFTVFRGQQKLDIVFNNLPADHPAHIVDGQAGRWLGVRRVVGYIIPVLCSGLLTVGAVLAHKNVLMFAK